MLSNEDCATVCCVTKIRMRESPIHSLNFFITMQRFMMPFMSTQKAEDPVSFFNYASFGGVKMKVVRLLKY